MGDKITLIGSVLGYDENRYTFPICPALVYLKVKVKKKVFDIFSERDMKSLKEEHPEIYQIIEEHSYAFKPELVENLEAKFTLKDVPVGQWDYIIAAYVDTRSYDITEKFGNNGFDENKEISSEQLNSTPLIENIIIPVKDVWYKEQLAKPKTDDPKRTMFIPGETL